MRYLVSKLLKQSIDWKEILFCDENYPPYFTSSDDVMFINKHKTLYYTFDGVNFNSSSSFPYSWGLSSIHDNIFYCYDDSYFYRITFNYNTGLFTFVSYPFDNLLSGRNYNDLVSPNSSACILVGKEGRIAIWNFNNSVIYKRIFSKNYNNYNLIGITFKDNIFYVLTSDGKIITSSDYGSSWSILNNDITGGVYNNCIFAGIDYCNDAFIITGYIQETVDTDYGSSDAIINDIIITTSDMSSFDINVLNTNSRANNAIYANNRYYVSCIDGLILTSINLVDWNILHSSVRIDTSHGICHFKRHIYSGDYTRYNILYKNI